MDMASFMAAISLALFLEILGETISLSSSIEWYLVLIWCIGLSWSCVIKVSKHSLFWRY